MSDKPSGETEKDAQADAKTEAAVGSGAEAKPESEADAKKEAAASEEKAAPEAKPESEADAKKEAAASEEKAAPEAKDAAKAAGEGESAAAAKAKPQAKARAKAAKPAKTAAAAPRIQEYEARSSLGELAHGLVRQTPSWLVSMVVHVVVLLLLALLTLPPPVLDVVRELVVAPDEGESLEEIDALDDAPLEEIDFAMDDVMVETTVETEAIDVSPFDEMSAVAVTVALSDIGLEHAPKGDLLNQVGSMTGKDLDGRGSGKARLVASNGGNDASEQAVKLGLKWLAEHQMPDGGWNFNHTACPRCNSQCRNPGNLSQARNGATGLALLPFLGAGQTHIKGEYKKQVKDGLYFLVNRMKVNANGGSLFESGGSMYSHGICAIVLCEAYAMTHDKSLYAPAQQSLNFIAYAQDPVGGGWRYSPRQPGDTSAVGWQIMAMKSGHMGYLRIPPVTVQKAFRFLNSVQANNGANYGYTDPGKGAGTTAVGLLCRMYLGWKKDNPALERGVKWISQQGPSPSNMYYNYYATQVVHHWEGDIWKKWNGAMRDQLVKSQAKKGHEKGSWHMGAGHTTDRGGRLYTTAMAVMVLEVYYRHLPIYRKQSTEEDFPLD